MTEDSVPPTKRIRPADAAISTPPNETLYLNNLNDKIKKPDLKIALYMLFSTYGQVISIIALKTPKMRGQAHVVFNSTAEATAALKALQGFEFFDKPIHIAYAKSKSDAIAKRDGTFKLRLPSSSTTSSLPPASVNAAIAAFDADDSAVPTTKRKREEEGAVAYANDSSNDEDDNDEDDN
ncbi:hypothetical protein DV451_000311 [Geotrichum candidum]|uniref:RRM domain-containing protein n=1 Tax=Geotrichum candidum TaxID=1173061 RepID=A0A9P5GA58_GEOCN|nr:hypothetical protein DV451_000311 [Geotrichum candidum]KAF5108690.1 hypothetical protein DV453_002081 [Geotrichum candidum]